MTTKLTMGKGEDARLAMLTQRSPLKEKGDFGLRWAVLVLSCVNMIGCYYCYDCPSALNENLLEHFSPKLSVGEFEYYFSLLYTVYSLPNVILPFMFGYLIDRYGARKLLLALTGFIVAGQLVVTAGSYFLSMPLMLLGRIIFGFGGESINVASMVLVMQYFRSHESSFALALCLCFSRLGSVLNDCLSPILADYLGVTGALFSGCALLCSCFVACIGLVYLDSMIEKQVEDENALVLACAPEDKEMTDLKSVMLFGRLYWSLVVMAVSLYCCILPFNNIASAFLVEEWYSTMPPLQAHILSGRVMSILFAFSAVSSPFFGVFCDKFGLRALICEAAAVILICAHWMLIHIRPPYSMFAMGLGYSLIATAVWPCVGLAVGERQQGTAYGLLTAMQNVGLALVPLQVAFLRERTGRYVVVEHFFMMLAVFGFFVAVYVNYLDRKDGGKLNAGNGQPRAELRIPKTLTKKMLAEGIDDISDTSSTTDKSEFGEVSSVSTERSALIRPDGGCGVYGISSVTNRV